MTTDAVNTLPLTTLPGYLQHLRRRKFLVLGGLAGAVILGLIYLAVVTPSYTVTLVVAAVENEGPGMSELGSISSLLSLGRTPATLAKSYQDLINTPFFASRLIAKHPEILHHLYPDQWDAEKKEWHPPSNIKFFIKRMLFGVIGRTAWAPPGADALSEQLTNNVSIAPSKENAYIVIEYKTYDATFGKNLLGWLHAEADANMRARDVNSTDSRIQFLKYMLTQTENVAEQQAINRMIMFNVNKLLNVKNNLPYAMEVIAAPMSTDLPRDPKPFKILLIAIVLGGAFIVLLSWLSYLRSLNTPA